MKIFLSGIVFIVYSFCGYAQSVVLVEQFTETGCGACAQNDSAFNAHMNATADKVAVITYHCYYMLDTFYTYNKGGDARWAFYKLNQGYPAAMVNGKMPATNSSHLSYVSEPLINAEYNRPPQFKFDIVCTPTSKDGSHSANIKVKVKALKDNPGKDLRLFVVVTENNINHEERYHTKSVNGINEFNHIFRAALPDNSGTLIGSQATGQEKKVNLSYTNDDKEINYKEVRLVVFVQDYETKEVLGVVVTKNHPFRKLRK